MLGSKKVARGLAVGLTLALAGCVGLGGGWPSGTPEAAGWAPDPRPAAPPRYGPDLRIPDATARATDIPLVPVPPPPLGREPAARPTPPSSPGAPADTQAPITPVRATTAPPPADKPSPKPPPAPDGGGTATARAPVLTSAPSTSGQAPANPTVRQLQQQAAERFAHVDSYIARLTRREQVNGENRPEEVMLFKFRKEPWGVYFKWLGTSGQGREVIYVRGRHENKIHTLLAAGDHPLMGAGKRLSLAVDSIFVRSACRHPITEAGIGASVERLGVLLEVLERGEKRKGTLTALGPQNRPEFDKPVQAVEHVFAGGVDPALPRGGKRTYYFDPESRLPLLVIARDERGQEVEYYSYDRLQYPVRLDDDDFNPDKLWSKPKPAARPAGAAPAGPLLDPPGH